MTNDQRDNLLAAIAVARILGVAVPVGIQAMPSPSLPV